MYFQTPVKLKRMRAGENEKTLFEGEKTLFEGEKTLFEGEKTL